MSQYESRVFDRGRPMFSGLEFLQSSALPACASSPVYRSDADNPPSDTTRNWTSYDHQAEDWGDILSTYKSPKVTRVAFQNIGVQEKFSNGDKSHWNAKAFLHGNYDLFLFAEHNLMTSMLSSGNSWQDRMNMGRRKTFSIVKNNANDSPNYKWNRAGGVALTLTQLYKGRKAKILPEDSDHTKLGRWCSARLHKERGGFTRLVSAYCPCNNINNRGTVYNQHLRYFRDEGTDGNPVDLFRRDLTASINSWVLSNESVLLGIDANESVINGELRQILADIGLFEIVCSHHHNLSAPATQNRNPQSKTIRLQWKL